MIISQLSEKFSWFFKEAGQANINTSSFFVTIVSKDKKESNDMMYRMLNKTSFYFLLENSQ